jgi:putative transcriptional regulator
VPAEPELTSLRGQLLIASPALVDPNFARTVVLVAEHSEEGAMGLVLNRPSDVPVADAVGHLAGLVEEGAAVFLGGPVQQEAVVALAEVDDPDALAVPALAGVGFLPGDANPDELAESTHRVRVYAGYAGWGAGQLESELGESAWFVEPARPDDVFSREPERLWSEVLRRKGGSYAVLSLMPADPSVN